MKLYFTILFTLMLSTSAQSQKTKSLEGMNPNEIRQLLLTQTESPKARELIIKHNQTRKTAYVFFGAAVLLTAISGNSSNPDKDNKNSILTAVGAASSGLIAIVCGISAGEQMNKAKKIYLDSNQASFFHESIRRSPEERINKYLGVSVN